MAAQYILALLVWIRIPVSQPNAAVVQRLKTELS